jgi:chromosome segregation ATPase
VVDALAEDHVRHSERSGKLSAQAQKLTFQRDHIGAQRDRLVQAIKEGAPVAALSKEMDALQTKWDALDRQVQELLAEINEGDYTLSQLEEARSNLSQGLRFIASKGTAEQQTMFLQEFVEEVRVARSVEQLVVKANIAAPLNQTQNNEPVSKGTRVRTLSLMARKSGQRMKCSPA